MLWQHMNPLLVQRHQVCYLPEISADLPSSAAQAGDFAIKNKSSHRISILTERITRKNMDVLVAQVKPNVDLSFKRLNHRKHP